MSFAGRNEIHPGMKVKIVEKHNQRSGIPTVGTVERILTHSQIHPHGIKVKLTSGQVGRVKMILSDASAPTSPLTPKKIISRTLYQRSRS